jgi:hypothetical protein
MLVYIGMRVSCMLPLQAPLTGGTGTGDEKKRRGAFFLVDFFNCQEAASY